jgi:hypothetical protein
MVLMISVETLDTSVPDSRSFSRTTTARGESFAFGRDARSAPARAGGCTFGTPIFKSVLADSAGVFSAALLAINPVQRAFSAPLDDLTPEA